MTECYFIPSKETTSATICANCGLEKYLHTIGEGVKVSKVEIITESTPESKPMDAEGRAVNILCELCNLKDHKDRFGKDLYYRDVQPKLWQEAKIFLSSLSTPPASKEDREDKK